MTVLSPFTNDKPFIGLRNSFLGGTSVGGFSPRSLFSLGEVGAWYDPSDVANLNWRYNLLTYTEQFDNAAWAKTNGTATTNVIAAPNGTLTADKFTQNTASGYHSVDYIVAPSNDGLTYTASIYLKAAEASKVVLSYGRVRTQGARIDLIAGTTVNSSADSVSISNQGNGWYRCTVTCPSNGTGTQYMTVNIAQDDWTLIYTGNGTSGVYIWGAQIEVGSTVSPYQRISDVNTEVIERFPKATLYQAAAGTTPVTTPGQVVGLMLDKSRGLALGPELITAQADREFSSDTGFWLKNGAGVSITSGVARFTAAAANQSLQKDSFLTAGKVYEITVTVSNYSSGQLEIQAGGNNGTGFRVTSNGTFTVRLGGLGATLAFRSTLATALTCDIDNISVRELPGNHATQSGATSVRPIYAVEPATGRRNLLTYSEDFSNSAWVKSFTTVSGTQTVTYAGGLGTPTSRYIENRTTIAGGTANKTFTFSAIVSGSGKIRLKNTQNGVADNFSADITLSATPTLVSLTVTNVAGGSGVQTGGFVASSDDVAFTLTATNIQMETGSIATAYQRVVSQYDVTEIGVASRHYLFFDGIDDWMQTGTINPESALFVEGPELVTNGGFDTDTAWNKSFATISDGTASIQANGSITQKVIPLEVGRMFQITLTVVSTAGAVIVYCGTPSSTNTAHARQFSAPGTYTFFLQSAGLNTDFRIGSNPVGISVVDNVSVREAVGVANKVQVFAGVRKLSDASYPLVVEHSTTANSNNGAFAIIASGAVSGSAGWTLTARGTTSVQAQVGSGYASPITNVITGLGDISNDSALLRVNGAQVAQSVADQGTGNYLAYPLYIGRRGGTSLPFNGHLYGMIVRFGANLSTSQITKAERWMGAKTGVTI